MKIMNLKLFLSNNNNEHPVDIADNGRLDEFKILVHAILKVLKKLNTQYPRSRMGCHAVVCNKVPEFFSQYVIVVRHNTRY